MLTVTGTYNTVQNIRQIIRFNEPTTVTGVDANNNPTSTPGWYEAVIVTEMQAVDTLGGQRDIQNVTPVGTARATIFTPQELAAMVQGTGSSTGAFLLGELTKAYTEAIGSLTS
jgi:hypothetical protein